MKEDGGEYPKLSEEAGDSGRSSQRDTERQALV